MLDLGTTQVIFEARAGSNLYCSSVKGQMRRGTVFVDEVGQGISDLVPVRSCQMLGSIEATLVGIDLGGDVGSYGFHRCPEGIRHKFPLQTFHVKHPVGSIPAAYWQDSRSYSSLSSRS
jgi:hypothetical protein